MGIDGPLSPSCSFRAINPIGHEKARIKGIQAAFDLGVGAGLGLRVQYPFTVGADKGEALGHPLATVGQNSGFV